jgi:aryl-alcohol dehydrogenase-like predicted oxidoreductase
MQYRTLGRTGLRVSDVGFGAMTIGGEIFGATDDQESLRALHRAVDLGMNFIDTADAYGRGHSEELLAQVLKTRRNEVVLATKVVINLPSVSCGILTRTTLPQRWKPASSAYRLTRLTCISSIITPEVMQRGEIFEP